MKNLSIVKRGSIYRDLNVDRSMKISVTAEKSLASNFKAAASFSDELTGLFSVGTSSLDVGCMNRISWDCGEFGVATTSSSDEITGLFASDTSSLDIVGLSSIECSWGEIECGSDSYTYVTVEGYSGTGIVSSEEKSFTFTVISSGNLKVVWLRDSRHIVIKENSSLIL